MLDIDRAELNYIVIQVLREAVVVQHSRRGMEKGISSARSSRRGGRSVPSTSASTETVSVGTGAPRASAEAVAAQNVEDDVEDSDKDLCGDRDELQVGRAEWTGLTVTMTLTMIMMMFAIAETIALIAPPIAEKIAPCEQKECQYVWKGAHTAGSICIP